MFAQILPIFINVITPVFALVLIGYIAGPRLDIQAKSLSRLAYFILIPAFIFLTFVNADLGNSVVIRMIIYMIIVEVVIAVVALIIGKVLRKPAPMIAAYILIMVFGNVGNFGLPLIEFRLGEAALFPATVYFLVISTTAFIIGVGAASSQSGKASYLTPLISVLKTPSILAFLFALPLNLANVQIPLFSQRLLDLPARAMVPVMLIALGVQLAENRDFSITKDVVIASLLRLAVAPAIAFLLVGFFGLTGIERGAGIIQSGMPAAVLCSIIAMEHNLMPKFVTKVVLFSTLASVVTLTILLALV